MGMLGAAEKCLLMEPNLVVVQRQSPSLAGLCRACVPPHSEDRGFPTSLQRSLPGQAPTAQWLQWAGLHRHQWTWTKLPCLGWVAAPEFLPHPEHLPMESLASLLSSKALRLRPLQPFQTPSLLQPAPREDRLGASLIPQDPHWGCWMLEQLDTGAACWGAAADLVPGSAGVADASGDVGGGSRKPAPLEAVVTA